MTQKLLLAESLDLLRQCEQREYDVDRNKQRISSDSQYRNELGRLLQSYDGVYQQYVRGLCILNHVRHTALSERDPKSAEYSRKLSEFCAGKMTAYMARCDSIVRKMDGILLPIQQVDLVVKEGYVPDEAIYLQDGMTYPLSRREKVLAKEFMLMAGTYILTLKNRDDYTLAAPEVNVTLATLPQRGSGAEPLRVELKLPCQCGWRKVIGIVDASTVQLEIRYSGIRDAHVDILLQRWASADEMGRSGGAGACASGPGPALSPSTFDSGDGSSFCKSASKASATPNRGGNGSAAGGNMDALSYYTPANAATNIAAAQALPHQQQPQHWVNQLPQLPDDELARLANYKVPSASLSRGPNPRAAVDGLGASSASAPAEDLWATLTSLNVPHAPTTGGALNSASPMHVPGPVEVNSAGMTCRQRLDKIRELLNAWPNNGVAACPLPGQSQQFIQALYALPLPRELSK
ncbi:hypothetical protein JKF63_07160 [Porcisia hertigi]|uniref:Uncharacterized protein n=1 Tax=Porcisia hertigi TaxID=2761500 RepID=A0A837A960_9TRYP|nr:hypothetical protein JKF63_07160 [Porcisia hertigi]